MGGWALEQAPRGSHHGTSLTAFKCLDNALSHMVWFLVLCRAKSQTYMILVPFNSAYSVWFFLAVNSEGKEAEKLHRLWPWDQSKQKFWKLGKYKLCIYYYLLLSLNAIIVVGIGRRKKILLTGQRKARLPFNSFVCILWTLCLYLKCQFSSGSKNQHSRPPTLIFGSATKHI